MFVGRHDNCTSIGAQQEGLCVQMRVLIDRSCVEIYLSSGEVLSTRVYRGQQPVDSDAGIDFVAFGGNARVEVMARFRSPSYVAHHWQWQLSACMPLYCCLYLQRSSSISMMPCESLGTW